MEFQAEKGCLRRYDYTGSANTVFSLFFIIVVLLSFVNFVA